MVVLWVLVVAAIVFGVALLALGRGDALADAPADRVEPYLPDRPMAPEDVDAIRLPQTLRGYRMWEVDTVLARLRDELAARDAELAAWRATAPVADPSVASVVAEPVDPGRVDDPKSPLDPGA